MINAIGIGIPFNRIVVGASYTAEYQAILDSGIGTPPATEAGREADDLLIRKAKEIGLWDASPRFYMHMTASEDPVYAAMDWKNPGENVADLINSPAYTPKVGFKGDGSSSRIDYNFVPASYSGDLFPSGDCALGQYVYDNVANNFVFTLGVIAGGEGGWRLVARRTTNQATFRAQDNTETTSGGGVTSSVGMYILRRNGSQKQLHKSGEGSLTNTFSVGSVNHIAFSLNALCQNNGGSVSGFSSNTVSCMLMFKQSLVTNANIVQMMNEHIERMNAL